MKWKRSALILFSVVMIAITVSGIIIFFPSIFIKPVESSEEIVLPNLNNLTIEETTKYLQENIKLANFTSYEEIVDYLLISTINDGNYYRYIQPISFAEFGVAPVKTSANAAPNLVYSQTSRSTVDYSTTNVQVIGIDEPDIVKTDGEYIYVINSYENTVKIIKAYPIDEMKIVSQINISEGIVDSIFITGNKLIVLVNNVYPKFSGITYSLPGVNYRFKVLIYDISNKEHPKLISKIESRGNIFDARLTKDHLYLLVRHHVNLWTVCPVVTKINNKTIKIDCNQIKYFKGIYSFYYDLLKIYNIPIDNPNELELQTILTPSNTVLYMSNNSIYLALYGNYVPKVVFDILFYHLLPNITENKEAANKIRKIWSSNKFTYVKINEIFGLLEIYGINYSKLNDKNITQKITEIGNKFTDVSIILKIKINNLKFGDSKIGIVPGKLLNQWSMDEYKGYLRVATTTGRWWREWGNNLYVLDKDLKIIGKIEGFEKGERIYAVRFYRDRALVVTYRQLDPLLVINLSNPENPKIEGALKIPGYSTYLHPLDNEFKLILGIGIEGWGKIKVSLFDVSNMTNPIELDKWIPKYYYTYSEALYNHHAFLYVKKKKLVVIPYIGERRYKVCPYEKRGNSYERLPYTYCYYDYKNVVKVALIKIENNNLNVTEIKIKESTRYYWGYYYNYPVRSLYIDDVLYIVTPEKIIALNMSTGKTLKELSIGQWSYTYRYYYPVYLG